MLQTCGKWLCHWGEHDFATEWNRVMKVKFLTSKTLEEFEGLTKAISKECICCTWRTGKKKKQAALGIPKELKRGRKRERERERRKQEKDVPTKLDQSRGPIWNFPFLQHVFWYAEICPPSRLRVPTRSSQTRECLVNDCISGQTVL